MSSLVKGDVPIICVDEVFKFFASVLSPSKNISGSATLNMDRLWFQSKRFLCRALHYLEIFGTDMAKSFKLQKWISLRGFDPIWLTRFYIT